MREAKTRLSKQVEPPARGEPFVIARAGQPSVGVMAVEAPATPKRRGFLAGGIRVPADFDSMGSAEVAALFEGD